MSESLWYVRVSKELERMGKNPPTGIFMWAVGDNLENLEATIEGQPDTPYAGGEFKLSITIPQKYPNVPPVIKFKTQIYHPNIDRSGRICLDSLKAQPAGTWSPTLALENVLIQIQCLMAQPNPTDPLDVEIAQQFSENNAKYIETAKSWTAKYAKPKNDSATSKMTIDIDESD